jgi:hypothetical protein
MSCLGASDRRSPGFANPWTTRAECWSRAGFIDETDQAKTVVPGSAAHAARLNHQSFIGHPASRVTSF